jgi:hypothetical protein
VNGSQLQLIRSEAAEDRDVPSVMVFSGYTLDNLGELPEFRVAYLIGGPNFLVDCPYIREVPGTFFFD